MAFQWCDAPSRVEPIAAFRDGYSIARNNNRLFAIMRPT